MNTDLQTQIIQTFGESRNDVVSWLVSPKFYMQLGVVGLAIVSAFLVSLVVRRAIEGLSTTDSSGGGHPILAFIDRLRALAFPLINIFFLEIAVELADATWQQAWLVRFAQSLAVLFLLYSVITKYIEKRAIRTLLTWIGMPVAVLHVFGWLVIVTNYLDSISLTAGDIRLSLYVILRTGIFGAVLFWLGRLSNNVGKRAIRNQIALDVGTREVIAKLFEITLFVVVFLLLLQVMGIDLTALAVFGGALGVGLGFGLQQIASNFVSGIIILLDRSITIGDFVELNDGRSGTLRELNMRFGILETFDGKDIMVPNEQFITSSYKNWTHQNAKQRYPLNFEVAYSTDLDKLFANIRQICAEHPKVISGDHLPIEERPDAEIAGFRDSGIEILVEFWIEGVDDGKNRVGADLLHSIWRSIQENGMQIPFPQREVRILNDNTTISDRTIK
ncbi:MAG: small-conductance mechanosensitive channel [Gammaproteobacteria bacterium]|jgi:small-conductance mechanosensitive channel